MEHDSAVFVISYLLDRDCKQEYVERLLISSLGYTWESRADSIPMNQTLGDFVSYAIRMRFSVHASVLRARLTKFLIAAFGQGIARSVH